MSLKIIKIEPRLARVIFIAAAVLCLIAAWFIIKWNFANTIAAHLDSQRVESRQVAEWLTQVAPSDPQTNFAEALILEKTFDAGDLTRSLAGYEIAAALSPHNYLMWLTLGKSRSSNGDREGADKAYRRALDLAPSYASVQWAYGNSLIRNDNLKDGFAMIAKAAAADTELSKPAASTALQTFDGDVDRARHALGDIDVVNSALAAVLAGSSKFDSAFDAWSKITPDQKAAKYQKQGETLSGQMADAKQFRYAVRVAADVQPSEAERPFIGKVLNGGFENGVKLNNAGMFDWRISEGAEPQIGLSESQKQAGKYSLFLMFNTFESAGFRSVSQLVAVEPEGAYTLELYYRSDVKTASSFKWEVADAATSQPIAVTPPLTPAAEWTPVSVKFLVPSGSDGVIIRLARDGCSGPACPTNGKLLFDEFSLKRQ